jgi:hypothetical protein
MKDQTFAHRPPSTGVHLLSDPLPERVVSMAATSTNEAKSLTRARHRAKARKSGQVGG